LKKQKEAWEEERNNLNIHRDSLKEECSKIQEAIKEVKEKMLASANK
jgi:predicted ATP-grasp superfamily ATP-dependent carboligase